MRGGTRAAHATITELSDRETKKMTGNGSRARILVDNDDAATADAIAQVLRESGFVVEAVAERSEPANGTNAVIVECDQPDALRRAEEARHESEDRFAFVRRATGVGYWYCDLPFDVLHWDEHVKAHFHLPADAFVNIDTFYDRLHPDDRQRTRDAIAVAIDQRTAYDIEYRTVDPDTGAIKWIRAIGRADYGPDGTPKRFDGVTIDVSNGKRTSEQAAEAADRLTLIADAMPALIAYVDADARYRFNNRGYEQWFGHDRDDIHGCLVSEVVGDDAYAVIEPHVRKALDGERVSFEAEIPFSDDQRRTVHCDYVPDERADGSVAGFYALITDITLRRQHDRASARLAAIVQSSSDAIISKTLDGVIESWNEGAERIFGYTAEEAIGRPVTMLIPEDRLGEETQIIGAIRTGQRIEHYETIRRRKDGSLVNISLTVSPVLDSNGRIIGASKIARDITERTRFENALRESESRFKAMANTAPAMLWVTDADGTATFLSRGWHEFTGRPQHGGLDADWFEAVHPQDRREFQRSLLDANRRREAFSIDYRLRRHDGMYRWCIAHGRPRFDNDERYLGFVGSVIDAHERKKAELERSAQSRILEMIASEEPLAEILNELVRSAEQQIPGTTGSILLLDPDGKRLRHGAAPGLPDAYNRAIDGVEIGPAVGSCGTAAYRGERVIVEDIQSDPLWADYRKTAEAHGLRACWSQPILSADGRTIGTSAIYFNEPKRPIDDELTTLQATAQFAGLAIDRHRTLQALRDSEARFRAFTTATSDAVYRMNADWTEMQQLQGQQFIPDTLEPSRSWLQRYVYADDRPGVLEAIDRAIRTREMFEMEHRVIRLDGSIGWTQSRAVPIFDDQGTIQEWFGAASDVTARKQAEESLEQQRRLYEGVLTTTPDLAYIFDLDHRFIYANEGLLRMWGKTWDEAIGRNCLELGYEPWHAELHDKEIERVVATKTPIRGEVPFTGTAGRRIYDYIFTPILNDDGEVIAVAGTTRDVTDMKLAEEEIREARSRLESTLAAAEIGTWEFDIVKNAVGADRNLAFLFGMTTEEADQAPVERYLEAIHAEDRPRVERSIARAIESEDTYEAEYRVVPSPGQPVRWVVARGRVERDPDGTPVRLPGVVVDITERKRFEEALRESEDRFKVMANAAPAMLWVTAPDGSATFLSRGWYEYTGQTELEVDGFGWLEGVHPDDREHSHRIFEEANANQDPFSLDYRLRRADGQYRWCISAGKPSFDENGRFLGYVGSVIDVHERKQAETALRAAHDQVKQARDYAEATLRTSPVPLLVLESDLRVSSANEAFYEMFDTGPDDTEGRFLHELGNREWDIPELRELLGKVLEQSDGFQGFEVEPHFETIGTRSMLLNARLMDNEEGEPDRVVLVMEDITQRREHEERMATVMAELNHRVKNTLAVVDAIASQTLRHANSLNSFKKSFGERLRAIANVHSLLTGTDWTGCSLEEIVRSEIDPRRASPNQASIRGPALTLSPKQCLALHMVVHELATNAMKYGALKGESGHIDIAWETHSRDGVRWLKFEWRERCEGNLTTSGEPGYGSSLIEQTVNYELRGELEKELAPSGLTCTISFPLSAHELPVPESPSGATLQTDSTGSKPRVLVVEDNGTIAQVLVDELEEMGVDVVGPANTLEKAMQLVEGKPPAAALLDVDLDGTKVYPLARLLRERQVRFLLLTGYDKADLPEDLRESTILGKPICPDELKAMLGQIGLHSR